MRITPSEYFDKACCANSQTSSVLLSLVSDDSSASSAASDKASRGPLLPSRLRFSQVRELGGRPVCPVQVRAHELTGVF